LHSIVRRLAVLSMHTSPLAQPGSGDGGGMNVYVRELSTALARAGVTCEVFTRASRPDQPEVVRVEPGFQVHHVPAGALAEVPKEALPDLVPAFTRGVLERLDRQETDAIHANYWLSGLAGHTIKHELDLPLVSTFHTLARVKAEASEDEPVRRAQAEAEIIGCSDAVLASCTVEKAQIVRLYGADPDRIEIVAPGVDRAFFAPGDRAQARRALGLPAAQPIVLFAGRIQPLKALDVAVAAVSRLEVPALLVAVGGPSGPAGPAELDRVGKLVAELGLVDRVRFVPPQRHELLTTYYRAADVCVVPSRSESFGLVALEAAACGTPVIASAVGGLRTLVEHGRTGFLVEGRDPGAFAAYLGEVLTNPGLAREMSASAAVRARRYTWSIAGARLRRLYADLTARQLVECR
jgi:D-inositol-3-phosphate glycosyltransferase